MDDTTAGAFTTALTVLTTAGTVLIAELPRASVLWRGRTDDDPAPLFADPLLLIGSAKARRRAEAGALPFATGKSWRSSSDSPLFLVLFPWLPPLLILVLFVESAAS